jgi:hypothetical protein
MQLRSGLQKKEYAMSYSTISLWDVTDWTDAHEALAREKFVPMIMSVGADRVQMVRTGDKSFCVITEYVDAQTAEKAQKRIAEIRGHAAEELPMTMASASAGSVFAHG